MQHLLRELAAGRPLSAGEAVEAFGLIMAGDATPAQAASLLSFIEARGVAEDELYGAARAMRDRVTPVQTPDGMTIIDTCGTGGDGSSTFNISTAAAIVAASAGFPLGVGVAKHGNRSVTSRSGSSQVLQTLGVNVEAACQTQTRCLEEAGICFCFAPSHHPAMRHAGPIRKELGFRTIFNLVGPLTNPAGAKRQLIGVFASGLTAMIARVLARLGSEAAMVVHGTIPDEDGIHIDGFDELSTCGPSKVSRLRDGVVETFEIDPLDLGLPFSHPSSLRVDGPDASAKVIRDTLAGQHGPARDITCLNAAAALMVAGAVEEVKAGMQLCGEAIDSGAAEKTLATLARLTQGLP